MALENGVKKNMATPQTLGENTAKVPQLLRCCLLHLLTDADSIFPFIAKKQAVKEKMMEDKRNGRNHTGTIGL